MIVKEGHMIEKHDITVKEGEKMKVNDGYDSEGRWNDDEER